MSGMKGVLIKNFSKDIAYFRIILLNDDLFHQRLEVINKTVYYVVRYIGTAEKASKFKHKFKLEKSSDKISVSNVVSSYNVDVQDIHSSGKCVKLHYDTLERFLDEKNNLKFCVKISKI
jgi:hypothetical protein